MSNRENQKELKIIEEEAAPSEEVLRLKGDEEAIAAKPVDRLPVAPPPEEATRLDAGETGDERRTHEPDIDVIIDAEEEAADPEEEWVGARKPAPYGWFVMIALIVVLAVLGSTLVGDKDEPTTGEVAREAASDRNEADIIAEREAKALVEEVEGRITSYLAADTVDGMLPHVRHPDRVGPLIREWYKGRDQKPREFRGLMVFEPLNFGTSTFWKAVVSVGSGDGGQEELEPILLEQTGIDSVRIDWETSVRHQPIPWDEFVSDRPEGAPMDFRVKVAPDLRGFYSHEFSDDQVWRGFELTAPDSEDFVIGYLKRNSDLERKMYELYLDNGRRAMALILRLSIPEGTQSPRGVVIEEIVSPHWLILDAE